MFCGLCGTKIQEGSRFCPTCGAPVEMKGSETLKESVSEEMTKTVDNEETTVLYQTEVVQEQQKEKQGVEESKKEKEPIKKQKTESMQKSKKGKVAIISAGSLIGVIGTGAVITGICFLNSPARAVMVELNEADAKDAELIYNSDVHGNKLQEWLLKQLLDGNLSKIPREYSIGKTDFETVLAQLQAISDLQFSETDGNLHECLKKLAEKISMEYTEEKIDFDTAEEDLNALLQLSTEADVNVFITDILAQVKALKNSRDSYIDAEESFLKQDFESAISGYSFVIESDENYADAQEKLVISQDNYREQILNNIGTPNTNEEFEEALRILERALTVIPKDSAFTEKYQAVYEQYAGILKQDALKNASAFIDTGDFVSAISLVDKALGYNEGDSELEGLLISVQSEYETYVTNQVNVAVAAYDYETAFTVLDQAMEVLPESTVLEDLYKSVEASKPTPLNELKISESNLYSEVTELVITEDVVGNQYDPKNLFVLSATDDSWEDPESGYAKYYLNGEYTKLRGTLAVGDQSEIGECTFTIYGDDRVLYTSETLTRTTAPIALEVDVTGVSWIQIILSVPESDQDMSVLLSEFTLYKN